MHDTYVYVYRCIHNSSFTVKHIVYLCHAAPLVALPHSYLIRLLMSIYKMIRYYILLYTFRYHATTVLCFLRL